MSSLSTALRAACVTGILLAAAIVILFSGGIDRIERDVSSFLPQSDSPEARLARNLINQQQAKSAYLLLESPHPDSAAALEAALSASPAIKRFELIDESLPLTGLNLNEADRLTLLFPKRFAALRSAFAAEPDTDQNFEAWAAQTSVEELDAALQSPEFIELSQSELFDPLLLAINALLSLPGTEEAHFENESEKDDDAYPYWLRLAGSGMDPNFQELYASEIQRIQQAMLELDPQASLSSGGLVELATASRERIQSDVFKINLISAFGVGFAAFALLRRFSPLLAAVPTLLAALLGALAISSIVFEQINIIVLIIGSVLIGTSIDYALHMLLGSKRGSPINSRKLLFFACLSSVAGFCALLFSSMELVRQIGVFVASGLACAYAVAACFRPLAVQPERLGSKVGPGFLKAGWTVLALFIAVSLWGLATLDWQEDLAKLEAADPQKVEADIALRQRFGEAPERTLIVSTGDTFLQALQEQSDLLREAANEDDSLLALSSILPTLAEVEYAASNRESIDRFFAAFADALDESGYEVEAFASFFEAARQLPAADVFSDDVENRIQAISEGLSGPSAFLLQGQAGFASTALATELPPTAFLSTLAQRENSILLSNLAFLNRHLESTREELARWGALALATVAVIIILAFGARRGLTLLAYPAAGFAAALGTANAIQGPLSLFHLIGGFLGAALALDYALFSCAHFRMGKPIPPSVWLSYATTGAAFAALLFSAIEVVQAIGLTVLLLTSFTTLTLLLTQSLYSKSPQHGLP